MNTNYKIILFLIVGISMGLGLGYLVFVPASHPTESSIHQHGDHEDSESVWTCSMHPQIRQPNAGDCPICGMDLIVAGSTQNTDPTRLEMTEAAVQLANVQTQKVGAKPGEGVVSTLSFTGRVMADERRVSSQVTHLPGRIEKLYVSLEGEYLQKGQRVAEVYAPDLIQAQQELLQAKQLEGTNPKLVTAARKKLMFWKMDSLWIAKLEKTEQVQETFTIYATNNGVIRNRKISVGDYLQKGASLFELLDLSKVWITFEVYEQDLPRIELGQKVAFSTGLEGYPPFSGKIQFIDPIINSQTRVGTFRVIANNTKGILKPDLFVEGRIEFATEKGNNLEVPMSAVLWTGKRSVVYVKLEGTSVPTFQFREVVLGNATGNTYEIEQGLEPGEEVVVNGSFTLDAAAQLNNQRSMMNQSVTVKGGVEEIVEVPDFTKETDPSFRQRLEKIIQAYLSLKDALVATDYQAATQKGKAFVAIIQASKLEVTPPPANDYWSKSKVSLLQHGKMLSMSQNVSGQRKQFEFITTSMVNLMKAFGTQTTYYIQHCPMAFDNTGADWVSDVEAIRNPYFGDEMLTCGFVDAQIDPKSE